jgi:hypothetical protein
MNNGVSIYCTAVYLWIYDCADMALPSTAGRLIGRPAMRVLTGIFSVLFIVGPWLLLLVQ